LIMDLVTWSPGGAAFPLFRVWKRAFAVGIYGRGRERT
jgi:hypothetical protein